MDNVRSEIFKYFIPQIELHSKNRTYFRWERGNNYVEVQIPGFKIGKHGTHEKRPWITSGFVYSYRVKSGSSAYKHLSSSQEYDRTQLGFLLQKLKEL